MMTFWTPQFPQWQVGFNDIDMPWHAMYDYVEIYNYNKKSTKKDNHNNCCHHNN